MGKFRLAFFFFDRMPPPYSNYGLAIYLPVVVCIPILGWLADARYGNYRVFKAGSVLLFLAVTAGNISSSVNEYSFNTHSSVPSYAAAIQIVSNFVGLIGGAACFITALQLGLDQMPDSSAANITSFLAWLIFSVFLDYGSHMFYIAH